MITDIIRITITIRSSTIAVVIIIPIIIGAKGVVVLGTTLEVEVVLVVIGVIEGVIKVEVVLVRVVLGCGVVASSDGVTLEEEKEEVNDEESVREEEKEEVNNEETVGKEEKEEVNNEETVREEEKEEVNDEETVGEEVNNGNDVGKGVVVGNGVIEGVPVAFSTDVDIVILALLVTPTVEEISLVISTVEETILAVVSPMDDVLIDIIDITVLVPGTGGVVVIKVVNIEELSPDSISSPLPLALP